MPKHMDILSFWFGNLEESPTYLRERGALWFGGAPATDALIRRKFADEVEQAARGELSQWEENPLQCLALILLLDQFALNIYRGQARGFEVSALALPVARRAVEEERFDQRFHPLQRQFFYLPFEHSEDPRDQARAAELMHALAAEAKNPALQKWFRETAWFADEHQRVIERFGRFPGRNQALGRPSTPEENEYLAQGGSPF